MFDYSNLVGLMAAKGITRQEMAKRVGMSKTYFSTVIKQGKPIPTDVAFRIAQQLDMTEYKDYFFVLNVQ